MTHTWKRSRRFGLIALSIVTAFALQPSGQLAIASAPTSYPMLGHSPARTAVSPDTTVSASNWSNLELRHAVSLGGSIMASPAVAYDARLNTRVVYVGTMGSTPSFDAIDSGSGSILWTYPLSGNVVSSPAVYRNTVYFGTEDGFVYALDAARGTLACRFDTGGRVEASPLVENVDGTGPLVFVGDAGISESHNAGHEWAINGVGNQQPKCTERWMFNGWGNTNGGHNTGSWSSPALAGDGTGRQLLVFGSSQPDDSVYALDARSGSEIWRYQTFVAADTDVGATPTISAPGVNGL